MNIRTSLLITTLLFASCGYNEPPPPTPPASAAPAPTMTMETLRELWPGHAVAVDGVGAVVLAGYVTTSDRAGNFHRTFMIQDETGAVEIRAGLYDLHNHYRPGQRVTVRANGLMLGMSNGVLQLGLKSAAAPDYFNHRVVAERYLYPGDDHLDVPPRTVRPSELQPEWCGSLVQIEGLHLDPPADTTWALPARMTALGTPQSASLKFRMKPARDSIYVFTSGYASFAGEKVPAGPLSLRGILMRGQVDGREVYQIKMRDLDDVEPLHN